MRGRQNYSINLAGRVKSRRFVIPRPPLLVVPRRQVELLRLEFARIPRGDECSQALFREFVVL